MAVNYVGIPSTAHGYNVGDSITIAGTVNYDGTYTVETGTTADKVVIAAAYVEETFPLTPAATMTRHRTATNDTIVFPGAMNIALAIDDGRTLTLKSITSTVNINAIPSR